jgi:hypothetical protein
MQNNVSICHFERKDNEINTYLSKIVTDCLTFHFLKYGNTSLYSEVKNFCYF